MPKFSKWLAISAFFCGSVMAQTYPDRPIKLVVPFPPGGSADAVGRPLAEKLSALLGQPVVIDNRGGGNTVIGAEIVARAPADGYTLFLMPGAHALSPRLLRSIPFHPVDDFTLIALIATTPYVIFGSPKNPFKTLPEMLKYASSHPQAVSVGTTDALGKVTTATLNRISKVQLTEVSYKGAGPLVSDVVGGHLALGVNTPAVTAGLQKAGTAVALAVTSGKRLSAMPDVPTVAEAAGIPDFDIQTWFALAGPAKMPAAAVARLQAAMADVLKDTAIRERLSNLGMEPNENPGSPFAASFIQKYSDRMGKMLEASGIRPQ